MRLLLALLLAFSVTAQIPGTFRVTGPVAPPATNSNFGASLPVYNYGGLLTGLSSLSQLQDTSRYPLARRHAGMVASLTDGTFYQLASDLTTWTEVSLDQLQPLTRQPFANVQWYNPTITLGTVNSASPYQYNHDASVAYFDGKWYAVWNANTNAVESAAGQVNLLSTSLNFSSWTAPIAPFISSTYSTNPVSYSYSTNVQWQPSLLVNGSELWCIWAQEVAVSFPVTLKAYFSKLTSSSAKWQNLELSVNITNQGRVYYPFPTQNPIRLASGRVLAPVVWNSPTQFSPTPSPYSPGFYTNYKLAGVIYTDDGGATWHVGGYTTVPDKPYQVWEPFISVGQNGALRMFCRNLDYLNAADEDFMLTAPGYGDGLFFGALESAKMEVNTTRYGYETQPFSQRTFMFGPDTKDTLNPSVDRQNVAMFTSHTGGDDYVAGIGLGYLPKVQLYPQVFYRNDNIYGVYSYGPIPRSIESFVISPAPVATNFYAIPRKNYYYNHQLNYVATAPSHFTNTGYGIMASVTNTSTSWGASTNVSVGAWVNPSEITSSGAAIADTRDNDAKTGFLFAITSTGVRLATFSGTNASTSNYDYAVSIPTNAWTYVGFSLDTATPEVTFYVVDAAGTASTSTVAMSAPVNDTDGNSLYITSPFPLSTVGKLNGRIRRLTALANVSATVNNHRYWHGLDQVALGVTDWAGTETSPGTASSSFSATDPNAGSNNATWLAEWSKTGTEYAGQAVLSTYLSESAIEIKGYGSAGIELPTAYPSSGDQVQFTFSFALPAHAESGKQITIATFGAYNTRVELLTRTAGVLEAFDANQGLYTTFGAYNTNQWRQIAVSWGIGGLQIADINGGVYRYFNGSALPRIYLGAGYVNRDVLSTDSYVYIRMADLTVGANRFSDDSFYRLAQRNEWPSVSIRANQPTIQLRDANSSVTNYFASQGDGLYFSQDNSDAPTDEGAKLYFDFDGPLLSVFGSETEAPQIRVGVSSDTTTPLHVTRRSLGTFSAPTAVTNGILLGGFRAGGHDGISFEPARSGFDVEAVGTHTNTNWETRLGFKVIRNGDTNTSPAAYINGDNSWEILSDILGNGWVVSVQNVTNQLFTVKAGSTEVFKVGTAGQIQTTGVSLTLGTSGPQVINVTGSPEGAVNGVVGSLALRNNGGVGSTLYTKETGSGNTGWRPVAPIRVSPTLSFASISANSTATATATLTGASTAAGQLPIAAPQTALTSGLIIAGVRISSANTIEVMLYNPTAGALGTTNVWDIGVIR